MKNALKGFGVVGLVLALAVSFAALTACQKAGEKSAEKMAEDAIVWIASLKDDVIRLIRLP
jgi:hypothetical protein